MKTKSIILLVVIVLKGSRRVKLFKIVLDVNQILFIISLFFGK